MIEYGHVCLLIFAQGTWKESFKKKLLKEVKNEFIAKMDINEVDEWSEIEQISLFNPKNPGENDHPCDLCNSLYEIYEEKRGNNDSLFLFSHNILGWVGMEKFLLFVLGEVKVKKILYLELGPDSYLVSTSKKIPQIIKKISHLKVNRSEFFKLFEDKKVEFSIIYEVGKY